MTIRVTCTKCMARFNVSEKFSGREGPCPKCQTVIRIPEASEDVVIHAPDNAGPRDTKGRLVLKPIGRSETQLTAVQIVLIACTVVGFLSGSLILRTVFADPATMPGWLIPGILVGLAPACVLGAYTFLRDQEAGAIAGRDLLFRVLICSAVYAGTWLAMPVARYAFGGEYGLGPLLTASLVMLGTGMLAAALILDLDWMMGFVHYGLYFGCSLLLRFCAGVGAFPGEGAGPGVAPIPGVPGQGLPVPVPQVPLGFLVESLQVVAAPWTGWS